MNKSLVCGVAWIAIAWMCGLLCPAVAVAIEVHPTSAHVRSALDRGKAAAARRDAPEIFYTRFGSSEDLHAGGYLVTKLEGVSVMAAHMALRGLESSAADIAHVLEAPMMLISTVMFGDSPSFAVDSYLVLDQGGKIIKPITVRTDGQADRSSAWPASPQFKARVMALFNYADFDPNAQTTIMLFPASGGEVRLSVDFSQIQ